VGVVGDDWAPYSEASSQMGKSAYVVERWGTGLGRWIMFELSGTDRESWTPCLSERLLLFKFAGTGMALVGRGNRWPEEGTWCCSRRRASFPEGLVVRVGDGGGELLEKALGMEVSVNGSKRLVDFTVEITVASACEGVDWVMVGIGGEGWRPCFPR
jgi:hypothetical protein